MPSTPGRTSLRVLVTFAGGRGHLLPLLPLARALAEAGHDLALAGQADAVQALGVFGMLFPDASSGPSPQAAVGTGTLASPDLEHELAVVGRWYAGTLAQRTLPRTEALISTWAPDLVVCDEMDFGSVAAARRCGVPCVVVDVIASGALTRSAYVGEALAALGLPDLGARHGDLRVVPFPASWRDPDFPAPADVLRVRPEVPKSTGPLHPAARWVAAAPAGAAYLTLGTIFNRESGDLFDRLLAGLVAGTGGGRVLATVGPDLDPASVLPEIERPDRDRVRVERWVPQQEVLPLVDVVVCHGGSGSVMAALSHDVPVVVVPMGADQELNAARVRATGVGVVLDPLTCTPAEVRAAVAHVRGDAGMAAAVGRASAEIAALPVAASLLPRLEGLARSCPRPG